ncbi:MAG: methyltransferase domain-containing protein, partial [Bdellovibrionales bacterium]|nr:methyltransferase domain-containing protein [Bdellovibrionales bacterium]
MAQIKHGIRKILERPAVYSMFQNMLGSQQSQQTLINQYFKLDDGVSVLDVGCGPADILEKMPETIKYCGIDFEKAYIEKAKAKYGDRGRFYC